MKKKRPEVYDHQSLHEERAYGLFWYDWLWRLMRPFVVGAAALCIVAGIGLTAWQFVYGRYLAPVDLQDTTPIVFTVESGNSLTRVANNLEAASLIRNHGIFKYYVDLLGMGQKIQAGEYMLSRDMTLQQILAQLSSGDGKPITRRITVIPGWTIEDIARKFAEDGVIASAQAFLDACKSGTDYADYFYITNVMQAPMASQRLYALEGYLAPDTYEIYTTAKPEDIIKKLLSQTGVVFTQEYEERASELGMTMDQVITLASMIEKEAKTDEFKKVSAVFHNRLKLNMTLGSDVTIKYVTGSQKMQLSSADLAVNSPYNTYQVKGLPPGPICNPSKNAINAALYPDDQFIAEEYLYFCSKDPSEGTLHFSRTLAEHEAAVRQYSPLWVEYDRNRGLE